MAATAVKIVREGTPEAATWWTRSHVLIGKFRNQAEHGGGARLGSQCYAVWVRGFSAAHGAEVFAQGVQGRSRYEPETVNNLGQPGAWRSLPPTGEEVEAVVARAIQAVEKFDSIPPRADEDDDGA